MSKSILETLLIIKDNVAKGETKHAICIAFRNCHDGDLGDGREWLEKSFTLWPNFSKCQSYPIPWSDNDTKRNRESAFDFACLYGKLWDKTTAYGKLRHELLDFLIEQATKEVTQLQQTAE